MATVGYLAELTGHTAELHAGRAVEQAGALCFRTTQDNETQVLLLTSRGTGRWVVPKGNVEKHESARKCAAREAMEEAGVSGKVFKKPFGFYSYLKFDVKPVHIVTVFLLRVDRVDHECPESSERRYAWVPPIDAAALVDEPELRGLFRTLAKRHGQVPDSVTLQARRIGIPK
jgi:8-oxo-dGTP pyrophosphatase MutT (NUDIX family)